MTPYILVGGVAFIISGMTLYSGFGLGTVLMPVFALFFPVEVAVAVTAIVHAANNTLKIGVVGRHADRALVLRFGIPAILAALVGATALGYVSEFGAVASYRIGSRTAEITPLKLSIGALMLAFAMAELLPALRRLKLDRRYLVLGGVLSGFFGGFSGHQGALRAAFLVKAGGVTTQSFVGTNAVIGFMVDAARIATYAAFFLAAKSDSPIGANESPLLLTAIIGAFAGVLIGRRYLHKVTMGAVQTLTGVLLLGIAVALGAGLI